MYFDLTFYTLALCLFSVVYLNRDTPGFPSSVALVAIVTFAWLWTAICFREPNGDPYRYMLEFDVIRQLDISDIAGYERTPPGFTLLNWVSGQVGSASWFFFTCVYVMCLLPLYYALRIFLGRVDGTVALMLYSMYPFYVNYLASGFKQGIATGFVLVGIAKVVRRQPTGFIWLFVATLFHGSAWLCLFVIAGWYLLVRTSTTALIPVILSASLFLGASGLSQPIVESVVSNSLLQTLGFSSYFDMDFQSSREFIDENLTLGFRWDFAVFTLLPLGLWYVNRKASTGIADVVGIYSLMASVYFVMSFIPYADRVAGFAWALTPVIVYQITLDFRRKLYSRGAVISIVAIYPALMAGYMSKYFQ